MDAMAFGMGACCLQATFSSTSINQARFLYDQLHILAPIMMALSASTPIFNGRLSDIDTRWTVIAQSVDCRKINEKIPKSR
jgi:glutamate--cysteine ligase catalytic subunit